MSSRFSNMNVPDYSSIQNNSRFSNMEIPDYIGSDDEEELKKKKGINWGLRFSRAGSAIGNILGGAIKVGIGANPLVFGPGAISDIITKKNPLKNPLALQGLEQLNKGINSGLEGFYQTTLGKQPFGEPEEDIGPFRNWLGKGVDVANNAIANSWLSIQPRDPDKKEQWFSPGAGIPLGRFAYLGNPANEEETKETTKALLDNAVLALPDVILGGAGLAGQGIRAARIARANNLSNLAFKVGEKAPKIVNPLFGTAGYVGEEIPKLTSQAALKTGKTDAELLNLVDNALTPKSKSPEWLLPKPAISEAKPTLQELGISSKPWAGLAQEVNANLSLPSAKFPGLENNIGEIMANTPRGKELGGSGLIELLSPKSKKPASTSEILDEFNNMLEKLKERGAQKPPSAPLAPQVENISTVPTNTIPQVNLSKSSAPGENILAELEKLSQGVTRPEYQKGVMVERGKHLPAYTQKTGAWFDKQRDKVLDFLNTFGMAQGGSRSLRELNQELGRGGRIEQGQNAITEQLMSKFEKEIKKLPQDEREKIGQMIQGFRTVDPKYQDLINAYRQETAKNSLDLVNIDRELADRGLLAPEEMLLTAEKAAERPGTYTHDVYKPYVVGKEGFPGTGRGASKAKAVMADMSPTKKKMTLGEWAQVALNELPEEYGMKQFLKNISSDEPITLEEMAAMINSQSEAGKNPIELLMQNLPENIQTADKLSDLEKIGLWRKGQAGHLNDPLQLIESTMQSQFGNLRTRQLQKAMVDNPEWFSMEPKEGWYKVDATDLLPNGTARDRRLGPLNDQYMSPQALEFIKRQSKTPKAPNAAQKFLNALIGAWKGGKVTLGPALTRNVASQGLFFDEAGFPIYRPDNAKAWTKAVKDFADYKMGKPGTTAELNAREGAFGGTFGESEIRQLRDLEQAKSMNPVEAGLTWAAQGINKNWNRPLGNTYGLFDDAGRNYLIDRFMSVGHTRPEAISLANKGLMNYGQTSPALEFIRRVLGWLFPFATFSAKRPNIIAENLITRPWLYPKYPLGELAATHIFEQATGSTPEEVAAKQPRYMADKPYNFPVWKDPNGGINYADLSYTLPIGDWKKGFQDPQSFGNMFGTLGPIGSLSGFYNNMDPFTHRKIWEDTDSTAERTGKQLKYLINMIGPGITPHAFNIYDAALGGETGAQGYKDPRDLGLTALRASGLASVYKGTKNTALYKIITLEREIQDYGRAMAKARAEKNPDVKEIARIQEEIDKRLKMRQELVNGINQQK